MTPGSLNLRRNVPTARSILRYGPAAILILVTVSISVGQFTGHYPARFDWAENYEFLRVPTWIAVLLLGADASHAFTSIENVAESIGIIGGAIIWGYGVWWLLLSILTTARYIKEGIPFNLGWWGFTFPLGVYAVATLVLGEQTQLAFITNIGVGLVIALALFWCIIITRTIKGACCCTLFVDASLAKGSIPSDREADVV